MSSSSRRGLIALGATLVVLTAATPSMAQTGPASTSALAAARSLAPSGPPRTVTLITGDKVTATVTSDGHTTATVRAPNGRPVAPTS